ncbi:MAG: hypothetical protein LC793_02445 [Thermomicrobia bacterium]|nr:hypothetical protein [Thermomicrobia bacterium]MCA1724777.1 hypothetical protein [Thermomicrobia bacterium]
MMVTTTSRDALIAKYIEKDPQRPWPGSERLVNYHTAIWALIGYYQHAGNGDVAQVARDYEVPEEAVEAALAFYRSHGAVKSVIDGHIAANEAA